MFAAQTNEGCLIEDLGSDFLRDYLQRDGLSATLRFAIIEELRFRADLAAGMEGEPDEDTMALWLSLRIEDEATRGSDGDRKRSDGISSMEGLVQAGTALEVGAVL